MNRRPVAGSPEAQQLNALIRELRNKRYEHEGLTGQALAAHLGVTTGSVVDWETGQNLPSAPHLVLWAHALGLRLAITDHKGTEVRVTPDLLAARRNALESYAQQELWRLAVALWTVRTALGLTQTQVAVMLETRREAVGNWESARDNPRPLGLVRWAHVLACQVRLLPR